MKVSSQGGSRVEHRGPGGEAGQGEGPDADRRQLSLGKRQPLPRATDGRRGRPEARSPQVSQRALTPAAPGGLKRKTEPRGTLTDARERLLPCSVGSGGGFLDRLAVPARRSGSGAKVPANTGNLSGGTGLVWGQGTPRCCLTLRTCTSARWDLTSTALSDKGRMELSGSGCCCSWGRSTCSGGTRAWNGTVAARFLGWPLGKHNSEGL